MKQPFEAGLFPTDEELGLQRSGAFDGPQEMHGPDLPTKEEQLGMAAQELANVALGAAQAKPESAKMDALLDEMRQKIGELGLSDRVIVLVDPFERLAFLRWALGIPAKEVAPLLRYSTSHIWNLENGLDQSMNATKRVRSLLGSGKLKSIAAKRRSGFGLERSEDS